MIMGKTLNSAIERLDIAAVENCLKGDIDLTGITLSFVIEQWGEADEDTFWGYSSLEGDLDLLRRIDKQKAAIVRKLIEAGVGFDDECLIRCYTYRCPKTAKVLLSNGANPNKRLRGTNSILLFIDNGRRFYGINEASEALLAQLEKTLKDYGALKFDYKTEEGQQDCKPLSTMVILMGLQASGKSTFFEKELKDKGFEHISLDSLKTRRREGEVLQKCINDNMSCVIDNTNPTKADRARYIIPGKHSDFRVVGYFLQSKLADCLERNENRDRQVPKKGILATFNKIEMPSLDEGFDELNFVSIENGEFKISKWIENEI
mgnify:CR=1 FL=1